MRLECAKASGHNVGVILEWYKKALDNFFVSLFHASDMEFRAGV